MARAPRGRDSRPTEPRRLGEGDSSASPELGVRSAARSQCGDQRAKHLHLRRAARTIRPGAPRDARRAAHANAPARARARTPRRRRRLPRPPRRGASRLLAPDDPRRGIPASSSRSSPTATTASARWRRHPERPWLASGSGLGQTQDGGEALPGRVPARRARESRIRYGGSFATKREATIRAGWIAGELAAHARPGPRHARRASRRRRRSARPRSAGRRAASTSPRTRGCSIAPPSRHAPPACSATGASTRSRPPTSPSSSRA